MSAPIALVTTANGTVGRNVVEHLLALGWAVRAASSRGTGPAQPGVEWVRFDFGDPATHDGALQGVSAIFLNAPPMFPTAVEDTGRVVDAARRLGVAKVVLMTNLFAGADPSSDHFRMEQIVVGSGLRWAVVRPTFFMQNFITQSGGSIRAEGAFYLPSGDGRVGFVDARDIGEVAARAIASDAFDGRYLGLTGPEILSHADVAVLLSQATGRTVTFVDIPAEAFAQALRSWGLSEAAVGFMVFLQDVVVRTNMAAVVTEVVQEVTGHAPRSFASFAADHVEAWR